jgi:hypothetical protein
MTEHRDDHRESVVKEPEPHLSESAIREKRPKGFLNPRTIKLCCGQGKTDTELSNFRQHFVVPRADIAQI